MEDVPVFFISSEEAGKIVCEIFKRSAEFLGRIIGIAGDRMTFTEQAAVLTDVIGGGRKFHSHKVHVYW